MSRNALSPMREGKKHGKKLEEEKECKGRVYCEIIILI